VQQFLLQNVLNNANDERSKQQLQVLWGLKNFSTIVATPTLTDRSRYTTLLPQLKLASGQLKTPSTSTLFNLTQDCAIRCLLFIDHFKTTALAPKTAPTMTASTTTTSTTSTTSSLTASVVAPRSPRPLPIPPPTLEVLNSLTESEATKVARSNFFKLTSSYSIIDAKDPNGNGHYAVVCNCTLGDTIATYKILMDPNRYRFFVFNKDRKVVEYNEKDDEGKHANAIAYYDTSINANIIVAGVGNNTICSYHLGTEVSLAVLEDYISREVEKLLGNLKTSPLTFSLGNELNLVWDGEQASIGGLEIKTWQELAQKMTLPDQTNYVFYRVLLLVLTVIF